MEKPDIEQVIDAYRDVQPGVTRDALKDFIRHIEKKLEDTLAGRVTYTDEDKGYLQGFLETLTPAPQQITGRIAEFMNWVDSVLAQIANVQVEGVRNKLQELLGARSRASEPPIARVAAPPEPPQAAREEARQAYAFFERVQGMEEAGLSPHRGNVLREILRDLVVLFQGRQTRALEHQQLVTMARELAEWAQDQSRPENARNTAQDIAHFLALTISVLQPATPPTAGAAAAGAPAPAPSPAPAAAPTSDPNVARTLPANEPLADDAYRYRRGVSVLSIAGYGFNPCKRVSRLMRVLETMYRAGGPAPDRNQLSRVVTGLAHWRAQEQNRRSTEAAQIADAIVEFILRAERALWPKLDPIEVETAPADTEVDDEADDIDIYTDEDAMEAQEYLDRLYKLSRNQNDRPPLNIRREMKRVLVELRDFYEGDSRTCPAPAEIRQVRTGLEEWMDRDRYDDLEEDVLKLSDDIARFLQEAEPEAQRVHPEPPPAPVPAPAVAPAAAPTPAAAPATPAAAAAPTHTAASTPVAASQADAEHPEDEHPEGNPSQDERPIYRRVLDWFSKKRKAWEDWQDGDR